MSVKLRTVFGGIAALALINLLVTGTAAEEAKVAEPIWTTLSRPEAQHIKPAAAPLKVQRKVHLAQLAPSVAPVNRVSADSVDSENNPAAAGSASKSRAKEEKGIQSEKKSNARQFNGIADYYADMFHGKRTASGQVHDRRRFTAAHRTLPFGTHLRITNKRSGKSCIVLVNDRGPFTQNRIIDLSYAAAKEIGLLSGKRAVECAVVEDQENDPVTD